MCLYKIYYTIRVVFETTLELGQSSVRTTTLTNQIQGSFTNEITNFSIFSTENNWT